VASSGADTVPGALASEFEFVYATAPCHVMEPGVGSCLPPGSSNTEENYCTSGCSWMPIPVYDEDGEPVFPAEGSPE
jgi:hypothetical protein